MPLEGKGFFIWQIPNCDGGNPAAIAARASAAGLTHVMIKIADGVNWIYNYDRETKIDYVPPVQRALKEAGIQVWGWHYVRGDDPVGEARMAIRRTRELGLDGYVIDAEKEYRKTSKRPAARRFMKELRAALEDLPIALSTYRYPRLHAELPFAEFLEDCDLAMPQVYFEQAHNPEQQLEKCVEQYMSLRPARPVVPTAPAYKAGGWTPTPEDLKRFLVKAREMELRAVNVWSWDYATRPALLDLWKAVADFDWATGSELGDMPEKLIGRLNERDPEKIASLYGQYAAHVTGARTVLGVDAIREWYEVMFRDILPNGQFTLTGKSSLGPTRRFTWVASGDRGTVADGNDILGLRDGKIEFQYSFFTVG
jgi:hypothetical protein